MPRCGHLALACCATIASIGSIAGLAQPLSAQVEAGSVVGVDERNPRYRKRFADLLLSESRRDLHVGWLLARDLGPPVAPLLWSMFQAENSNVDRRLVLLIAAVQAGGLAGDRRLFEMFDQPRPMLQERTMACLLIALGPQRSRPVPNLWSRLIGPNREPEPLLGVAARLACARFPDAAGGVPMATGDDPGRVAAALFAGLPVSWKFQQRMWRAKDRHADLWRRGALLGERLRLARGGSDPRWLEQAREYIDVLDLRRQPVRAAATLLLTQAGALAGALDQPDWQMLQLIGSRRSSAEVLRTRLQPSPLAIDERPERLAVVYALLQPVEQILRERTTWSEEPRIRRHVAVALAMRLTGEEAIALPDGGLPALPAVPEWPFAVWAGGGAAAFADGIEDGRLRQLAHMVAAGRAPRAAVHEALEQALWRWGSHPGIGPWRHEHMLVRDLLLSGSNRGGGKYLPSLQPHLRYFPTGLDRNDEFFAIGVAAYEFLDEPAVPMPAEHRW